MKGFINDSGNHKGFKSTQKTGRREKILPDCDEGIRA
jgi:hypothetical protein